MMESAPPTRGTASRKSSQVVVIAHNDIADIKVRKQSANLLAQQLQQQLILQQQQLQRIVRRDQVTTFRRTGSCCVWVILDKCPYKR